MLKYSFFILTICTVFSQNNFKAIIIDHESNKPLVGANAYIVGTRIGNVSDENGNVHITNIPNGNQKITVSFIGYKDITMRVLFPMKQSVPKEISLEHDETEHDEVIVTSTRSSRTIADIPTRIEAISGEELEEKGNMKPGDIRMLLNESTGIQTQQTSATSNNSSIRIQGLDGKYTQILKDGYPIYGAFSGGLSLLQIVPLDLKQVEVIKGASSTLYGGDAISGLVNLISKTPSDDREINVLLNATSALGLDASTFYSNKNDKVGTTIFASYNIGTPYDPANNGFTAIPKFERVTFNPKLFYYLNEKSTFNLGLNTIIENREGGDIEKIKGNGDAVHSYFEKNKTTRVSGFFGFDHQYNKHTKLSIKNSLNHYNREITIPNFKFSGKQFSTFSEINYGYFNDHSEWIVGLNFWTDKFTQDHFNGFATIDYTHKTYGLFAQNTWSITKSLSVENGLRLDKQNKYGTFLLPRTSILYKVDSDLSFRLGAGLGYKTPNVFTEESEKIQFRNVIGINNDKINAEESVGVNFDINFRTVLSNAITFSINNLFFYTRIDNPLVLNKRIDSIYEFQQPTGFVDSKGLETNIKLTYDHYKLFIGYTLADVNKHYGEVTTEADLVSKHRLNNVLMYEIHDDMRIGLEAYYFSKQTLSNDRVGKDYWIMGLMTEKMFEGFSVFLNFENFLDTRQSKFEKIYSGTITNPIFNDIYAPVDGFVINGGIKINL